MAASPVKDSEKPARAWLQKAIKDHQKRHRSLGSKDQREYFYALAHDVYSKAVAPDHPHYATCELIARAVEAYKGPEKNFFVLARKVYNAIEPYNGRRS